MPEELRSPLDVRRVAQYNRVQSSAYERNQPWACRFIRTVPRDSSALDAEELCRPMTMFAWTVYLSFIGVAWLLVLKPDDARKMDRLFVLVEEHLGYKLFKSVEQTKISFSGASAATFAFDHPGIELHEELFGADFRVFSTDLVEKIVGALDETLRLAGVTPDAIDIVCCTGGTARVPALATELERRFGKDKLRQHRHFHSVIGGLADKAQALLVG